MTYEDFLEDMRTRYAVIGVYLEIGEAARVLREKHARLFAHDEQLRMLIHTLADLRNLLIHQYHETDPSRLWEFIEHELEETIQLLALLKNTVCQRVKGKPS